MLSIVLPCYFEESNIRFIYGELQRTLNEHPGYEILFVDDGSRDRTFEEIRELARQDERVRGIRLSRNFGHQTALLAGLREARGEIVIMMDADGQHPASLIPDLIGKHREGYEIVNTRRHENSDAGWFKRASSRGFYRFMNMLSDVPIEPASADFRLMSRKALEAFLSMEEHDRFTRGLVGWMGFSQAVVEFDAPSRHTGKSKYTLRKMRRFAMDGITSFSSRPLRLSFYLGLTVMILGFLYAIYAVVMHFTGQTNPGWTSLLITILLLGGVQLFSLGIIGEYLGRIFHESKRRPHYFVQERTGDE